MQAQRTKIVAQLQTASNGFPATYGIFSYRGGQWTLVSSHVDALEAATNWVKFAINGQWGDCLEIRCNGVRVQLG